MFIIKNKTMPKAKSLLAKIKGTKKDEKEKIEDENFLQNITEEDNVNENLEKTDNNENNKSEEEWLDEEYEGQLSVDVYQTPDEIVIKSTIAGVKPEDLDVTINNDMVTIKGKREDSKEVSEENYFYQECYWGGFSRSIILPVEVKAEESKAQLKNGVLTIRLPKAKKSKAVSVKISEE